MNISVVFSAETALYESWHSELVGNHKEHISIIYALNNIRLVRTWCYDHYDWYKYVLIKQVKYTIIKLLYFYILQSLCYDIRSKDSW